MRCCIVRHGETAWNADRRLQGHQDIPLNDLGLAQAAAAGRYLGQYHAATPFAAVISSDLLRARQTAEAVGLALGLPVQLDAGLRERCYGQFEGKTPAEAALHDATAYTELVARADLQAQPGEAESLSVMVGRIELSLARWVRIYPTASVVIATHGGVLDVLYRCALGRRQSGPRDAPIPNAGLNWLEVGIDEAGERGLRWRMLAWGQTEHLASTSRDEIL